MAQTRYPGSKTKLTKVVIKTISFQEDGTYVVYCPALDLSAYGDTQKDAKESFEDAVEIYLEYAFEHGTLADDLLNHGWTLSRYPAVSYSSPPEEIVRDRMKRIVGTNAFEETSETIFLPA